MPHRRILSRSVFARGTALVLCLLSLGISPSGEAADHSPRVERLEKLFALPGLDDPWQFSLPYRGRQIRIEVEQREFSPDKVPPALHPFAKRRIFHRNANLRYANWMLSDFIERSEAFMQQNFRLLPESQNALRDVAVAIIRDSGSTDDLLRRHDQMLRALPDYSTIHMLVEKKNETLLRKNLANAPYKNRVKVLAFDDSRNANVATAAGTPSVAEVAWLRDSFLVLNKVAGGEAVVLVPFSYEGGDLEAPDNAHLYELEGMSRRIVSVPMFFQPGNMTLLKNNGKRTLLVGEWEAVKSEKLRQDTLGMPFPRERFEEALRLLTGADEVLFVPNSPSLFHIDLAMVELGNRYVGIVKPSSTDGVSGEDLRVLDTLRREVTARGFQVVDLPTNLAAIRGYQSPANAVPFTDYVTGKRKAMVPYFFSAPPEAVEQVSAEAAAVGAAYRSAGVEPIWVRDLFFEKGGNTHCAIMPFN